MNIFSSLMPSLPMFAAAFVFVSLVSGLIYWVAHLSSPKMRWVKIGGSIFACVTMFVSVSLAYGGIAPLYLLSFILGVLGLSAIQTIVERNIAGNHLALKDYLVRAFFSYIGSILVAGLFLASLVSFIVRAAPTNPVRSLNLGAVFYGFIVGMVVAPLSISFFRGMFQTLPLRPGIDRPLREDEIAR